jgi:hypothetical protein
MGIENTQRHVFSVVTGALQTFVQSAANDRSVPAADMAWRQRSQMLQPRLTETSAAMQKEKLPVVKGAACFMVPMTELRDESAVPGSASTGVNGPELPLARLPNAAPQLSHCSHWYFAQHFLTSLTFS